jgi:hypothetical protein
MQSHLPNPVRVPACVKSLHGAGKHLSVRYAVVVLLLGFFAFQTGRPYLLSEMDAHFSAYRDALYGCSRTQVWVTTNSHASAEKKTEAVAVKGAEVKDSFDSGVTTEDAGDEFWGCQGNVGGLLAAPVQPPMLPVGNAHPTAVVSWANLSDSKQLILEVDRLPLLQPPQA